LEGVFFQSKAESLSSRATLRPHEEPGSQSSGQHENPAHISGSRFQGRLGQRQRGAVKKTRWYTVPMIRLLPRKKWFDGITKRGKREEELRKERSFLFSLLPSGGTVVLLSVGLNFFEHPRRGRQRGRKLASPCPVMERKRGPQKEGFAARKGEGGHHFRLGRGALTQNSRTNAG